MPRDWRHDFHDRLDAATRAHDWDVYWQRKAEERAEKVESTPAKDSPTVDSKATEMDDM
ncbi:MAG: hypothetical protein FWC00_02595 [Firmicutes bacterium]|nr:hypothetical protein [Bacillota bacterium]